MIKFTRGGVTNPSTGEYKDIVVKSASPVGLKDALLGGFWLLVGVTYLTTAAFKNGAKAYEAAELETLIDAGLARPYEDSVE